MSEVSESSRTEQLSSIYIYILCSKFICFYRFLGGFKQWTGDIECLIFLDAFLVFLSSVLASIWFLTGVSANTFNFIFCLFRFFMIRFLDFGNCQTCPRVEIVWFCSCWNVLFLVSNFYIVGCVSIFIIMKLSYLFNSPLEKYLQTFYSENVYVHI